MKSQAQRDLAAEIREAEAKLNELRRQQKINSSQEAAREIARKAYEIMEKEADRLQVPFSVVLAMMNRMVFESDRLYERDGFEY